MARELVEYLIKVTTDTRAASGGFSKLITESKAAATGIGAVAAGFAAAGAASVAMANSFADAVDSIHTLASSTGHAAETIKGLEFAAASTGKQIESILPRDLPKRILEVANGTGEAREAFALLDIAVKDSSGNLRSSDDVLRDLINELGRVEDPTLRAALAQKALGDSASELFQTFADSGDLDAYIVMANNYGTQVGPGAQKATEAWQRSMAMLDLAVQGAQSRMAFLVEALAKVVYGFSAMSIVSSDTFDAMRRGQDPIEAMSKSWETLQRRASKFGEELRTVNRETDEFRETSEAAQDAMLQALGMPTTSDAGIRGKPAKPPKVDRAAQAQEDKEAARRLRLELNTADVNGQPMWVPALIDGIAADTQAQTDELHDVFADILAAMDRAATAGEETAMAVASESDTVQDGMSALSLAMGSVVDLVGIVGGATSMVEDVTTAIETLPEQLVALPEAVTGLVGALAELAPALIEAAPDIAMAMGEAMFSLAFAHVDVVATALAAVFEQLPGDIAAAIAEALRDLVGNVNPFNGDGFVGNAISGIAERIPFFEEGGHVNRTGLAYLHAGETVVPAVDSVRTAPMGGGINVQMVTPDPRMAAQDLAHAVGPYGLGLSLGGVR